MSPAVLVLLFLAGFASGLINASVFLAMGPVHFGAAGAMIGGQVFGARLGAGPVVRRGTGFILPVILCMVFAMTLKLMGDV